MKKFLLLFLVISTAAIYGQFKEELGEKVSIKESIGSDQPSSFFTGFFNPENLTMSHSVSMSYTAMGNHGIALGVYTNHLAYKFSEKFNLEVDASLVNSPYSSFGDDFSSRINGIYLSRARLNYQPSDNTFITLQFRQVPSGMGYGYRSPFYSNNDYWFGW